MAYLDDHPPARTQMRCPRRAQPSGVIVVHTAESMLDLIGADTGAEGVAAFISRRTDAPGSYHELVDSDSTVQVVRWTCEAFQDGTGSNPHAMGLSFALRAADWPKMTPARVTAFLRNGAKRAAAYARWVHAETGVVIPARRISRAESEALVPGFLSHGQRDPVRRTDPGEGFDWSQFLALYAAEMGTGPTPPADDDEDDMAPPTINFYKPDAGDQASNHAYLVVANQGKYLPTAEAIARAEYVGAKRSNSPSKPLDLVWRSMTALLDGPLRNV